MEWGGAFAYTLWNLEKEYFVWEDVDKIVLARHTEKLSKYRRRARKIVLWLVQIGFLTVDPTRGFKVNRDFEPNSLTEKVVPNDKS